MKDKRVFMFLSVFFAATFLVVFTGGAQPLFPYLGGKGPKAGSHAPIITHAFAVEKGYTGYIWKIYIEAEDPDGDMRRIASVVEEPGFGSYPTDWINLK